MMARFYSRCMKTIRELLDLLIANPDIHVGEHVSDDAESFAGVSTSLEIGLSSYYEQCFCYTPQMGNNVQILYLGPTV